MRLRLFLLLLLLAGAGSSLNAQFSGGFLAGFNFSKILGPSELDDAGREVESNEFKTGFHLGGRFNYRFTDLFGLRAELMYSQKGTLYRFDGQSYWVFQNDERELLFSTGVRTTELKIVDSYLEIPLLAYLRVGRFEVSGGGYVAWLFRSTGSGDLRYEGISELGNPIDPFTVALIYNYYSDVFQPSNIDDTQPVVVDGEVVRVPEVIGAQYDLVTQPSDRLYRRADYGLIGNVAVFINQGLFLSFRVNYGLADITREERDVSRVALNENNQPVFRDDFDRNFTLQASMGFNF